MGDSHSLLGVQSWKSEIKNILSINIIHSGIGWIRPRFVCEEIIFTKKMCEISVWLNVICVNLKGCYDSYVKIEIENMYNEDLWMKFVSDWYVRAV